MSTDQTIAEPRGTFATRMRTALAIDIAPTVLWGGLTILALIFIPALIARALYEAGLYRDISISTTAPASTIAAGFVVLSIIGLSEGGPGRRESVIGGWTRAQRLQLTFAFGGMLGVLAAVVWLLVALLQPLYEGWIESVTSPAEATVGLHDTVASPVAALVVAVSVFTAAFVPAMYVRLSHSHWTAVVAGSIPVLLLIQVFVIAYLFHAEPELLLLDALAGQPWMWLLLALALAGVYIAWVVAMSRTTSLKRYRA